MQQAIDVKKDLSTLFTLQAQETPDAIALEDESTKYTYSEVLDKVEKVI